VPADPPQAAPPDAYRAALQAALERAVVPFTAPYGRELKVAPETLLVEPWLDVSAEDPTALDGDAALTRERTTGLARVRPLVHNHGVHGLVVLGEAGAGKSTLARRLACAPEHRTPILLPVTAYAAALATSADTTLAEAAAAYWSTRGVPDLAAAFAEALAEGRALVILDGLDEAGTRGQRRTIAARIAADMARWRLPDNRWVITSRPHGYNDAPLPDRGVTLATLSSLDDAQLHEAITGWCRVLACWTAGSTVEADDAAVAAHATRLHDAVTRDDALHQLARSPLSLAMLVLLEHARGELPSSRIRLYEAFADELLQRRPQTATPRALDPAEFLIPLALWFQREHPTGHVDADALADECARIALRYEGYLRPQDAGPDVLALATARAHDFFTADRTEAAAGILAEAGPGVLAFAHRALQDFYVGRALARMPSERRWELLRPRLHAARWREPLLLCAGWLAEVERRRDDLDALCQQILTANSQHEPLLARDARLAIALATRSAGLVRHHRLGEMFDRLRQFSKVLPCMRGAFLWFSQCTTLARLGLRDAEAALRSALDEGDSTTMTLALMSMHGQLDGPDADHLRELASSHADSPDDLVRNAAWWILLPLWSRKPEIQERLLTLLQQGRVGSLLPDLSIALGRMLAATLPAGDVVHLIVENNGWLFGTMLGAFGKELVESADFPVMSRSIRESGQPQAHAILGALAVLSGDASLFRSIGEVLRQPDPGLRRLMLAGLADPRRGDTFREYIELARTDADPAIRAAADDIAAQLPFHRPDGAAFARERLAGDAAARQRVAVNLRSEWWTDSALRPDLLALFSPADPALATAAFTHGFRHLFAGQTELVDAALTALESTIPELRGAALRALSPHLPALPRAVDVALDLLARRAWPDIGPLLEALQRVIDARPAVRRAVCDVAVDATLAAPHRIAALTCLERIAHHDPVVWNTVRTLAELAATTDGVHASIGPRAHDVLLHLAEFLPGEPLRRGVVHRKGLRVGLLEETPTGSRFTYDDAWLSAADARPVSLTMPLRAEPYEHDGLHPFFDNMLPEGWLLERVSLREKIDKRDRLGILLATGSDTIGAVSVIPDDTPVEDG
jgi:HipA-like protein